MLTVFVWVFFVFIIRSFRFGLHECNAHGIIISHIITVIGTPKLVCLRIGLLKPLLSTLSNIGIFNKKTHSVGNMILACDRHNEFGFQSFDDMRFRLKRRRPLIRASRNDRGYLRPKLKCASFNI